MYGLGRSSLSGNMVIMPWLGGLVGRGERSMKLDEIMCAGMGWVSVTSLILQQIASVCRCGEEEGFPLILYFGHPTEQLVDIR
jgi:hypothetical protein